MPKTLYEFETPSNYTLVNTKIDGMGSLGLVPNPGQIFQNTFDDNTGFTQDDPLKSEFLAGVLTQKDQTPAGSRLAALYDTIINANWNKDGAVTAVLNGVPTIVTNRLQCFEAQGVEYSVTNSGVGAIKIKYKPNYTGSPSTNRNIVAIANAATGNSRIVLTHSPSGDNLRLTVIDSAGVTKVATDAIGGSNINLSAANTYEIEINWDNVAGVVRVFLDGNLHGTSSPGAWTHGVGAAKLYIGAATIIYNTANASFEDVVFFNVVKHTAAYVKGYTLPINIGLETRIDGPAFTYTGQGTILTVDDATFVEVGTPKYIVAGRYWDGATWAVSNGSYLQATDSATLIANLAALNAEGAEFVPWSVVFPNSNTLSSIDSFSVEVTGEITAAAGSIITNSYFVSNLIIGFMADVVVPVGDYLGLFAVVGLDSKLYHNGTNWVESDGFSQAQTNTYAEFVANIAVLIANNVQVQLGVYMESGNQTTTPTIDNACFQHNFGALKPSDPLRCNVYMYLEDLEGESIQDVKVNVRILRESTQYAEASSFVVLGSLQKVSDDEGFVSFRLIRSSQYETEADPMKYVIDFDLGDKKYVNLINFDAEGNPNPIEFLVPDLESINITDQIIAL